MRVSPFKRSRTVLAAAMLGGTLAVTGCAAGLGANDVQRSQAGRISRVDEGVIVSARFVNIEGTRSGVGTGAGAVIGGVAGQSLGGDDAGRIVGGVAGAVLGGLAGAAIEEGTTSQTGIEYTIRLERNGELITIVQGADLEIPPGTPVFVQYGQRARVVPQQQIR